MQFGRRYERPVSPGKELMLTVCTENIIAELCNVVENIMIMLAPYKKEKARYRASVIDMVREEKAIGIEYFADYLSDRFIDPVQSSDRKGKAIKIEGKTYAMTFNQIERTLLKLNGRTIPEFADKRKTDPETLISLVERYATLINLYSDAYLTFKDDEVYRALLRRKFYKMISQKSEPAESMVHPDEEPVDFLDCKLYVIPGETPMYYVDAPDGENMDVSITPANLLLALIDVLSFAAGYYRSAAGSLPVV